MRNVLTWVVVLGFCASMLAAANPATAPTTNPAGGWGVRQILTGDDKLPRVLLIGDSILQGYNAYAAEGLRGKFNLDIWVTPKHIASGDLPKDMAAIFAAHQYDVILFNDIGLHAWAPGRIPQGKYEPLLREHVARFKKLSPGAKLIFATTTPMTVKGKPTELDGEFNPLIVERNQIAAKVMAENQIPVADYYGLLVNKLNLAAGDRFHWTKPAYQILGAEAAGRILGVPPLRN